MLQRYTLGTYVQNSDVATAVLAHASVSDKDRQTQTELSYITIPGTPGSL